MIRKLLVFMLALAVVATGFLLALRTPQVADTLRQHLEQVATELWNVHLDITAMRIELWPVALEFDEVSLVAETQGLAISLERLRAVLRPWPSPSGAVVIDRLDIDNLRVDWTQPPSSGSEPSAFPKTFYRPPIDIRSLAVTGGGGGGPSRFSRAGSSVSLDGFRLELTSPTRSERLVHFGAESIAIVHDQQQTSLDLEVTVAFDGSLNRAKHLVVTELRGYLPRWRFSGTAQTELDDPSLKAKLDVVGSLAELPLSPEGLPPLAGALQLSVEVDGQKLRLMADVPALQIANTTVGHVALDAVWAGNNLGVTSFAVSQDELGRVTGSGQLTLSETLPFRLDAKAHGVSLATLLARLGSTGSPVNGQATMQVGALGTLAPFAAAGVMQGELGLRLQSGSQELLSLEALHVRTAFEVDSLALRLDELTVEKDGSVLSGRAQLELSSSKGLEAQAHSDKLDFGALGEVAGLRFLGAGAVGVSVEGPYREPTITATIAAQSFGIAPVLLGPTQATVIYRQGILDISRTQAALGTGRLDGALSLALADSPPTLAGHIQADSVPLGDVARLLGSKEALWRGCKGTLTGPIDLSGELALPHITASFDAASVQLFGAAFGSGPLSLALARVDSRPHLELDARLLSGRGSVRSQVTWDGPWSLLITTDSFDMTALRPMLGDTPIGGLLDARVSLVDLLEQRQGSIAAELTRFSAAGLELGTLTLSGMSEHDFVRLKGAMVGGQAQLTATLAWADSVPFSLVSTLTGLAVHEVSHALAPLQLTVYGSVFVQGRLLEPGTITADARVESARGAIARYGFRSSVPWRLQYGDAQLQINELGISGIDTPGTLTLTGHVSSSGLDLTASGQTNLSLIEPLWKGFLHADGTVALRLQAQGPITGPALSGSLEVERGTLRLDMLDEPLEDVTLRAVFADGAAQLQSGSFRLGGGEVLLGGRVEDVLSQKPLLGLSFELRHVQLAPTPELSTTLSGDLNLQGALSDLLLSGALDVLALRYTANYTLQDLIPKQELLPLAVKDFNPKQNVRLRVRVDAPGNLLLAGNLVEAEARANLILTGSLQRPSFLGTVTPLWGRVRYGSHTLTLESGALDFTDENRLTLQYDLAAHAQACGIDIHVRATGSSQTAPLVSASGADKDGPVGTQDVFTCLQYGLRTRDFEGPSGKGLSDTLPTSLDLVWAVSGMDEQMRKLYGGVVDELRLTSTWLRQKTTPRVYVGKELGQRIYLRYYRSLDEYSDQEFILEYNLGDGARLEGTVLTSNDDIIALDLGVDLKLHWELR